MRLVLRSLCISAILAGAWSRERQELSDIPFTATEWQASMGNPRDGRRHRMLSSLPEDLFVVGASKASVREVRGEPDLVIPSVKRDKYGRLGGVTTWRYRTALLTGLSIGHTESLRVEFDQYGLRRWRVVESDK